MIFLLSHSYKHKFVYSDHIKEYAVLRSDCNSVHLIDCLSF